MGPIPFMTYSIFFGNDYTIPRLITIHRREMKTYSDEAPMRELKYKFQVARQHPDRKTDEWRNTNPEMFVCFLDKYFNWDWNK